MKFKWQGNKTRIWGEMSCAYGWMKHETKGLVAQGMIRIEIDASKIA